MEDIFIQQEKTKAYSESSCKLEINGGQRTSYQCELKNEMNIFLQFSLIVIDEFFYSINWSLATLLKSVINFVSK